MCQIMLQTQLNDGHLNLFPHNIARIGQWLFHTNMQGCNTFFSQITGKPLYFGHYGIPLQVTSKLTSSPFQILDMFPVICYTCIL